MATRVKAALLLLCATLAVATAALIWADSQKDNRPSGPKTVQGATRPADMPAVQFRLRDQHGQIFNAKALRGQPAVITFLYTSCEEDCPTITQQIRGALDQSSSQIPVVAISVDPKGDTPVRAKRYLIKQHMSGRMTFLLGTKSQLEPIWNQFGVSPQTTGSDHVAHVVLIDSRGRQRIGFPLDKLTSQALANDITLLQREANATQAS